MASFGGIDNHTLTLLGDGRLVAIGGGVSVGVFNTATLGTISGGNSLYTASGTNYPIAVGYTAAVKLSDGRLLVVGGATADNLTSMTASAYFGTFTPGSNVITWTAGTPLPIALGAHTLTVLADGRVLVIGGNNGTAPVSASYLGTVATTYLGTITTGSNTITWAAGNPYPSSIELGQAALVSDGRVVVAGGLSSGGSLANTYFGSITSGSNTISWAAGTNLPTAMRSHTMVLLSTGQVLIVAGVNASGTFLNSTYFGAISGNTVTWNSGTNLPTAMVAASAVVMPDNSVILAGGISAYGNETPQAAQELTISGTTITYTTTTTGSAPSVTASAALVSSPDIVAAVSPVPVTASAALVSSPDVVAAVSPVPVVSSNFFTHAKYAAGANLTYSMGDANASVMQYSASVGTRLIYSFSDPDTIRYAAGAKFSATISVPTNDTIKYSAGAGIRYAAIKQQADTIKYSAGVKFSAKLMRDIGGKYSAAIHLSYSITTDTKANYGVGAKLKYSMLAGDGIAYKAGGRLTYSIVSSADNIAYKVGARIKYSISPASDSIRYSAGAKFSGYLRLASDMKYNAGFGVGIDYNIDSDYQDTLTYKACTSLKYYVDGSDKLAYRLKTATSYRANIDVTVDPPSYYQ